MKKVIRLFIELISYFVIVLLVFMLFKKIGWISGDIWTLSIGNMIGFILYKIIITILKK